MTGIGAEPARSGLPIRFGSASDFAAVRRALISADYTESGICQRTGSATIYDFRAINEGRTPTELRDALDALIRLFLDGEAVKTATLELLLPAGGIQTFETLGILRESEREPGTHYATVFLYPTESLYIISDLGHRAAGAAGAGQLLTDVVYPAITNNTHAFLAAVPRTPCERFLEMCGGTGIAALVAARFARHAWTADITERATQFAAFNAALNGLDNVSAVQGDLYAPLSGLTFDRIVAHPPYVAEPERRLIFRDGGPDGEQITRGLLAGLPDHLEPGGRFYCTCIATDRKRAPLEYRIREMIGAREGEFDIVLVSLEMHHPAEYYCRLAVTGRMPVAEAERRLQGYREFGVDRLVYCSMMVERHARARAPLTLRRQVGAVRVAEAMDWLLAWEDACRSPELRGRLLDARPRGVPGVRLRSEQVLVPDTGRDPGRERKEGNGGAPKAGAPAGQDDTGRGEARGSGENWSVESCELASDVPFTTTLVCSVDAATFLVRCDGVSTVREHAAKLVEEGLLPADGAEDALFELVRALIGAGCLEIDEFRLPTRVG
jgi:SAM-dependent methyltransferase